MSSRRAPAATHPPGRTPPERPGRTDSATAVAPGGLFDALVDDAAVFPPGLAPLPAAFTRHQAMRRSPAGRSIGPLLIRAASWPDLVRLAATANRSERPPAGRADKAAETTDVAVISRRGDDPAALLAALRDADATPNLRIRGIETALPTGEVDAAATVSAFAGDLAAGQHRYIEIDAAAPDPALRSIAAQRALTGRDVRGKFRTGGTQPDDSPDPAALATTITTVAALRLPIKFTAGLHHAVTGPHGPAGSRQFGVLNVIAATAQALAAFPEDPSGGAAFDEYDDALVRALTTTLLQEEAAALADTVRSHDADTVAGIRSVFISFGCCGALEPLRELAALGLLPPIDPISAPPEEISL